MMDFLLNVMSIAQEQEKGDTRGKGQLSREPVNSGVARLNGKRVNRTLLLKSHLKLGMSRVELPHQRRDEQQWHANNVVEMMAIRKDGCPLLCFLILLKCEVLVGKSVLL